MKVEFSFTEQPGENIPVSLQALYKVESDRTYDIKRSQDSQKEYAIFRTLRGEGKVIFKKGQIEKQKKDSLIITRWDRVGRYYCSSDTWDFFWLRFQSTGDLPLPLDRTISLRRTGDDEILINQCMDLMKDPFREAGVLASSLVSLMMHRWSYEWIQETKPRTAGQRKIDLLTSRMKENLRHKLSLKEMSRITGMSERYLRNIFKECTGETPTGYYHRIRMEVAVNLLSLTRLPVGEIADQLGFCDQFHFSRVFKEYYGHSPRSFRTEGLP